MKIDIYRENLVVLVLPKTKLHLFSNHMSFLIKPL